MSCAERARARRVPVAAAAAMLAVSAVGSASAADLASLIVVPEQGQSAEQTRRDRYECHNWAVGESGTVPQQQDAADRNDERRGRRLNKIAIGAAVGAALGGLARDRGGRRYRDDVGDGVLGGAVLGAAAGAVAGQVAENRREASDEDSDYIRALEACLAGRGYSLGEAAPPPDA